MTPIQSAASNPFPWLELVRAFAPLLAAGIAGYVAHKFGKIQASISRQQAETAAASAGIARNKLKLDLFDRRLHVYEAARIHLHKASLGYFSNNSRTTYLQAVQGAKWLFNDEIVQFLETELWNAVVALQEHVGGRELLIESDGKPAYAAKREALREVVRQLQIDLDVLFAPFLKLES